MPITLHAGSVASLALRYQGAPQRHIGRLAENALLEHHVARDRMIDVAAQRAWRAGCGRCRSRPSRSCRPVRHASRRSGRRESRSRSSLSPAARAAATGTGYSRFTSSSALIAPWNRIERTISAVPSATDSVDVQVVSHGGDALLARGLRRSSRYCWWRCAARSHARTPPSRARRSAAAPSPPGRAEPAGHAAGRCFRRRLV